MLFKRWNFLFKSIKNCDEDRFIVQKLKLIFKNKRKKLISISIIIWWNDDRIKYRNELKKHITLDYSYKSKYWNGGLRERVG